MARNASEMERAVARTLRDSLETLQRNREDVDQAVADLVSACSSARPGNTLPPLLRAQTAAAGLGATLNVLARFLTMAMQPGWSSPLAENETEIECEASVAPAVNQPQVAATPVAAAVPAPAPARVASPVVEAVPAQPAVAPAPVFVPVSVPVPVIEFPSVSSAVEPEPEPEPEPQLQPEPAAIEEALRSVAVESAPEPVPVPQETISVPVAASAPVSQAALAPELPAFEISEAAPPDPADLRTALELLEPIEEAVEPVAPQNAPPMAIAAAAQQEAVAAAPPVLERPVFDVAALPTDQQELHRRANRVAKVSMQDIKMLRPTDVVAGKESHDICLRLRDDIERAHKEYERRFHAILDHPVDYFYVWMVEILGEGDPRVLGNYPYSSPVARQ